MQKMRAALYHSVVLVISSSFLKCDARLQFGHHECVKSITPLLGLACDDVITHNTCLDPVQTLLYQSCFLFIAAQSYEYDTG
jgi:hypothetical protein